MSSNAALPATTERPASVSRLAWCVAGFFPVGLVIDSVFGLAGTIAISIVAWWLLALVWHRADPASRRALTVCVVWATAGELFLTEVWQLYTYRFGFLPPFVPPGHALLFQLGLWITSRLTDYTRALLRWLAVGSTLVAFVALGDQQSLLFIAVFVLLLRIGSSPAIYGTMFFLSLVLELIGTSLGTWVWAPHEPAFGLTTCNPPVAAGAFYCCLDALTLGWRKRAHQSTTLGASQQASS